MSLITLFNVPKPPVEEGKTVLDFLSFANMDSHLRIAAALKQNFNIDLPQIPILDPINPIAFEEWLGLHQTVHNQMNVPLQIAGQDFSELDTKNQEQVNSFVFLHASEHRQAENLLRIG